MPLAFHAHAPAYWHSLTDVEKEERARLSTELCSIDDKEFFIRVLLDIGIIHSGIDKF